MFCGGMRGAEMRAMYVEASTTFGMLVMQDWAGLSPVQPAKTCLEGSNGAPMGGNGQKTFMRLFVF